MLGAPKTTKVLIGNYELRLGGLPKAGLLTPEHSVGIVENVKLDVAGEKAELFAGFPQTRIDAAITKHVTGFSASLKESSRRNLNFMLNNGLRAYDSAASFVSGVVNNVTAPLEAGDTSLTMDISFTGTLSAGDLVVIYQVSDPSRLSICEVDTFTAKDGVTPASMTFSTNTPIVSDDVYATAFQVGEEVKLYKSIIAPIGAARAQPTFMSAQLIRVDKATEAPIIINFWKVQVPLNLSLAVSLTDFATVDMQVDAFRPVAIDYRSGGPLDHVAGRISVSPVAEIVDLPDSANNYS